MKRVARAFLVEILLAGGVLLAGWLVLFETLYRPNEFEPEEKVFYVSRGQSFPVIVDSLEGKGIIRDRALFALAARILGGTHRLQIGKYEVRSGVSNHDLFVMIREGKGMKFIPVTIPEGLLARAQARIFSRVLGIDSARYVRLVHDAEFARSLGVEAESLEGYLLPETYGFYWQPEEEDVITRLVREFQAFYVDSLQARTAELGWSTNQLLTFASIVEGEVVLPDEGRRIAGVYHNRLRKGMRLQADPTIQFIIDDGPRRILYQDLTIDHPYNTYRNRGLPPGPVNNPGKASILASLYPEHHNFIYFVANRQGGHWFSTNYNDHLRHVRRFRRLRAAEQHAAEASQQ